MNVMPKLRSMVVGGIVAIAMSTAAHATVFTTGNPGGSFDLGTGWLDQGDDRTLDIYWFVDADFAGEAFSLSRPSGTRRPWISARRNSPVKVKSAKRKP